MLTTPDVCTDRTGGGWAGLDTGSFLLSRVNLAAKFFVWFAVATVVEDDAVRECPTFDSVLEDEAEGLRSTRRSRRFEVDLDVISTVVLILRYFFIIGLSGAVKLSQLLLFR